MARYFALLGRRIEVQYRAGDMLLPAAGMLVADSGKSIFLEEHFCQRGTVKTFRWEIPYPCIVRLGEISAAPDACERSEEHTSELQSRLHLVCRLLLEKKKHHDVI